ncbi:hypothetical protein B0H11DRAFT_2356366 [Mycena galericulata]|nr:hypothetical protein B0H11DRAFT_2356366 [Mycena galericulata]
MPFIVSDVALISHRYNVEPFFFSSSLKWIPARYQEAVGEGDHITLTLTFIPSAPSSADQVIDTQAPLSLSFSDHILLPDVIAIHMVRSPRLSTIISYHPPHVHRTTAASVLRTRLLAAGQSVYWNKIFTSTIATDPTFVLLALLWYPLYAFDEALQALYDHICSLESRVMATTDMTLTQQLHVTPNPVLEHPSDARSPETIAFITELMRKESANLLSEISRLEQSRSMQDNRLKNVMNLEFSSVNLVDSRRMRELTEATVRDSAAMKQIAYLTMFFLPASLAASIFGMNVQEINPGTYGTIPHYVALTLPLTAVTVWIIMAFQYRKDPNQPVHDDDHETHKPTWSRFSWPLVTLRNLRFRRKGKGTSRNSKAATYSLNSRQAAAFELNSRPDSVPMSRMTSKAMEASTVS